MTTRTELRAATRGALEALAHFSGASFGAWGRNRDGSQLPSVGIFTPRWQIRANAVGYREDVVTLLVVVRRQEGDDLEDLLDADAEAVEGAVLSALAGMSDEIIPVSGENDVPGVGEKRVGTMVLTFEVTLLTDRPI